MVVKKTIGNVESKKTISQAVEINPWSLVPLSTFAKKQTYFAAVGAVSIPANSEQWVGIFQVPSGYQLKWINLAVLGPEGWGDIIRIGATVGVPPNESTFAWDWNYGFAELEWKEGLDFYSGDVIGCYVKNLNTTQNLNALIQVYGVLIEL